MDGSTAPSADRRTQATLWALAALPFLMAAASQLWPARPAPIAEAPERPPLAFDQYVVNYHEMAVRPVIDAYFQFTNRTEKTVRITKIIPSCGCLNPRLYDGKQEYGPGERGRFTLAVKTAREQPGPKQYTATVQYVAEGKPYEETLALRLVLPEQKITVEPAEVYFYQLTGQPDSRTIHVVDRRGGRLEVTGIRFDSEHARATLGKMQMDDDGRRRFPIRIDVDGDVPAGRKFVELKIATNDPEFDEIRAVVLIQGPSTDIVPASAEVPAPMSPR